MISSLGFSQEKVGLCNETDFFSIKHNKDKADFFGVSQIQNMEAEYVYRFWNTNNLLEIITEHGELKGRLIFAIKSVGGKNDGEFFRKIFELSQKNVDLINRIFNEKFDDLKVLSWGKGSDEISYTYERKLWNSYCEKSYSTCCNDENEAKYYLEIKKEIESVINYKMYSETFAQEIPYRSYTYHGVAYTVINFKK